MMLLYAHLKVLYLGSILQVFFFYQINIIKVFFLMELSTFIDFFTIFNMKITFRCSVVILYVKWLK